VSHLCAIWTVSNRRRHRQHAHNATPLSHRNAAATHTYMNKKQSTAKTIPHSAVHSHSRHGETRCSNAHATTQKRNRETAENHQSHTRPPRHTHVRAVRLPSVDGMLPESRLSLKPNTLQDTRTAIASHHGTRRRCRPQPAVRNASHRIESIKSNQMKNQSAHCMLSLKNSNWCQRPPNNTAKQTTGT
jgi:hypothetical protein